jgi:hypothetical protein
MQPRSVAVLVAAAIVPACASLLDIDGFEYVDAGSTSSGGGSGGASTDGGGGSGAGPATSTSNTTSASSAGGSGGSGGSGGAPPSCGNGEIDPGEDCDGGELGAADCFDIGMAGGELACDGDCFWTGCYDHYVQDFEGSGLPPGWSSRSPSWEVTADDAYDGAQSAVSGPIGDDASVTLSVTLTYDVAGDIVFWHLESTESCCDVLIFSIDSQVAHVWSDPVGWVEEVHGVGPGVHTFEWTYEKDPCCVEGADWVRIDALQAVNGYMP